MRAFALSVTLLYTPSAFVFAAQAFASTVGETAPSIELKNQDGKAFKLASRKDKGWTVLYFYPKAETPGCTKQACAFRDAIDVIHKQNAEVYGISADPVEAQSKFHAHHKLKFDLLADPELKAIQAYGVKMPVMNMAKRWTFVIDPELKIRWVNDKVDPAADPKMVSDKLKELQALAVKTK